MNQTARIISIYAADTSGVCSALYEYGGMTVIHDASGCNSTYTTHDEPRWYDKKSMMFISGITEKDAVMGNDDKFIDDLIIAANELKPAFIALCASPLPAMIGTDLDAIAFAVESETGIPSFSVKTNGMSSYISGAANAFVEISKHFTKENPDINASLNMSDKTDRLKINILGITPLDFPLRSSYDSLLEFINDSGFELNSCVGVNTCLEDIVNLSDADVNLVVSSVGVSLADHLYDEFSIPYVKGVPYGKEFSFRIGDYIKESFSTKTNIDSTKDLRCEGDTAILGESIQSASLASALLLDKGIKACVLETVGEGDLDILKPFDLSCDDEKILEDELRKFKTVLGDPLFKPIVHDADFIPLPHEAFSGRCFTKSAPNLIYTDLDFL
ncbi:MAG: nitrogenase component 1 [Lachnospiraceae bacterium]|nr:nitrogenase component 1 [Lachnospiraceae bacterium]